MVETLKRVPPKNSRKVWAQEVLEAAKANPNVWLRLEKKELARVGTLYLKPLGLKYTTLGTLASREGEASKFQEGTLYVMWEDK